MVEPLDPPLRVDWLDAEEFRDGLPGRLGLTFLPGKHGASTRYPGRVYRRELSRDLASLRDSGVRLLLLLVEDHELERWGEPEIVARAAEAGLRIERSPVPDGHAPSSMAEMEEMIATVTECRRTADVAVACMGGVGRTGMVAACALVSGGRRAADAIARVRAVRHPTAVETVEQVDFVRAYEGHIALGDPRSGTVAT